MPLKTVTLLLIMGILLQFPLLAQINISVAYEGGFPESQGYDDLLREHNDARTDYTDAFNEIRYMHGLGFGVRYRMNNTALRTTYNYSPKRLTARGNDFKNVIRNDYHSIRFELHQHFAFLVASAGIHYNILRINQRFESPGVQKKMHSDAWSSQFGIGYTNSDNRIVGWTLQPFVEIFWNEHDLEMLAEGLELTQGTRETDFMQFGIKLIIYNGPQ